jgi:hypothetical protein
MQTKEAEMKKTAIRSRYAIHSAVLLMLTLLGAGCVSTRANDTGTADAGPVPELGEMVYFLDPDLRFFPHTWSPQRKTAFMEHIQFPRYNVTSYMAMTLIHARMEIPVSEVDNFLRGHELDTPTFKKTTSARLIEHAFGRQSGNTLHTTTGERIELAWWQPGDTNQKTQYFWSHHIPSITPRYLIGIQVDRLSLSTAELYVRIEAD